jgi:hypothetical protein
VGFTKSPSSSLHSSWIKKKEQLISYNITRPYIHKTFKYEFCTGNLKLSNHNRVFIWYSVLIGWVFF